MVGVLNADTTASVVVLPSIEASIDDDGGGVVAAREMTATGQEKKVTAQETVTACVFQTPILLPSLLSCRQ